jgi:signal transduction histidine kinase
LTDTRVEEAMRAGGRSVTLITVLAAAGSLVMASLLTYLLTRPLLDLREMARKVAEGQLDARAPVWSNDEIGEVATAVNKMTDHLVASQAELTQTNRRLAAINRIMMAVEQEEEIHDALYTILETTVDLLNLESGWVYLYDPEREVFHLASWYNVPDALQASLLQEHQQAQCMCQTAMVDGMLPREPGVFHCQRTEACPGHALPCRHITIPIEARDQRFGLVNLLVNEEPFEDNAAYELLMAIGTQISESVANAWLRLKVRDQEMARQALLESLVEAQEEERVRLARELHDGAGQMLTSMLVRIKTLEKKESLPAIRAGLDSLLDLTSETIEQVRDLSYRLRPAALEQFGLAVALRVLTEEIAAEAHLEASCRVDLANGSLRPGVEVMLYRIAQEGLTNVVRHASASQVAVDLTSTDQRITMRIKDNGCGFEPYELTAKPGARHLGLISMRERAALTGGTLNVQSRPGQGTTIIVSIPSQGVVNQ